MPKPKDVQKALQKWGQSEVRTALKEMRQRLSMTQRELAERSGLNRSVIAQWELGHLELDSERLGKLWSALSEADTQLQSLLVEHGGSLRQMREAVGMSQRQVADLVGIRQETLSRVETGDLQLGEATYERLKGVLTQAAEEKRADLGRARLLEEWLEDAKRDLEEDAAPERNLERFASLAETIFETGLKIKELRKELETAPDAERPQIKFQVDFLEASRERWQNDLVLELVGWKRDYESKKSVVKTFPDKIAALKGEATPDKKVNALMALKPKKEEK
jgi:transcriptional regulator with XRE-family HTH domain